MVSLERFARRPGNFTQAVTELYGKYSEIYIYILSNIPKTQQNKAMGNQSAASAPDVSFLTELANRARSDKGSTYKAAHYYTRVYERVLPPRDTTINLLEIGLSRDGTAMMPSMRVWREYYGLDARLFGIDIRPGFHRFNDPAGNLWIGIGDQSSPASLLNVVQEQWGGPQFDVIIDDGSHASQHQQVTLNTLWHFLKPGGLYVIEDLHSQPKGDRGIKTRALLKRCQAQPEETCLPGISRDEIAEIRFFDSLSRGWPSNHTKDALVILRKK